MKRMFIVLLTVLLIVSFTSCHYTRYNLDNVPSLNVVGELGISWSTDHLTGFPREMLVYIWGEPTVIFEKTEIWDISETEVLALKFNKADRVETVLLIDRNQIELYVGGVEIDKAE